MGASAIGFSSVWLLASWLPPFFPHLLPLIPVRIPHTVQGPQDIVRTHPSLSELERDPHSTQQD